MTVATEDIEIALLLEGIRQKYGYGFGEYSRASVLRRLEKFMRDEKISTISGLQAVVMHDSLAMTRLVQTLSVNVTSMFRDPEFFLAFRTNAVPRLRTYPFLRFWVAGCASGQEAYSLAILLCETGLLERSRIYATDMSDHNLQMARSGMVPLKNMKEYTQNYQRSGGSEDFSNYYSARYDKVIFQKELTSKISFAQHNLAADKSFNEFHVIFCRNVMIYFSKDLQERVMHLFHNSTVPFGFLGLGVKEAIFPTSFRREYTELGDGTRLFQRLN